MKKIYAMKQNFLEDHTSLTPVTDVRGVNETKREYFIEKNTLEFYKIIKLFNKPRYSPTHGWYDIIVHVLDIDGCARTKAGDKAIRLGDRIIPQAKVIASTFIENPNNYFDIIFKDGNRDNLSISNLRWVSRSEIVKAGLNRKNSSSNEIPPMPETSEDEHLKKLFKVMFGDHWDDDDIVFNTPEWWTKDEIARRDKFGIEPDEDDPDVKARYEAWCATEGIDPTTFDEEEDEPVRRRRRRRKK